MVHSDEDPFVAGETEEDETMIMAPLLVEKLHVSDGYESLLWALHHQATQHVARLQLNRTCHRKSGYRPQIRRSYATLGIIRSRR